MSKKTILGLALPIALLLAGALSAFTPKVFFVNLFDKDVDVRLGETNNAVFIMNGLGPNKATYMVEAPSTGTYRLYFKVSTKDEWILWADEKDVAYDCDVQEGKDNCIVAGTDGHLEFFTLDENEGDGAKVCFFNGTDSKLTRMEVGPIWNSPSAFIKDISANAVSTFVSVTPGEYSLFWQYPEQVKKDKHYFYADKSGDNPEKFTFDAGEYYLFLAYQDGRSDYGTFYTITPQTPKKDPGTKKKRKGTGLND